MKFLFFVLFLVVFVKAVTLVELEKVAEVAYSDLVVTEEPYPARVAYIQSALRKLVEVGPLCPLYKILMNSLYLIFLKMGEIVVYENAQIAQGIDHDFAIHVALNAIAWKAKMLADQVRWFSDIEVVHSRHQVVISGMIQALIQEAINKISEIDEKSDWFADSSLKMDTLISREELFSTILKDFLSKYQGISAEEVATINLFEEAKRLLQMFDPAVNSEFQRGKPVIANRRGRKSSRNLSG